MPTRISQEYLKERLHYNPSTGVFTWLARDTSVAFNRQWNGKYAGKVAGCVHSYTGYYVISLSSIPGKYELYPAHRLAWLYMTGDWPPEFIDHIDRDRANNKFDNLRLATNSQNQANSPRHHDNTSGAKGVHWSHVHFCWMARITVKGKRIRLGLFGSLDEAAAAYRKASKEHFGEYSEAN